MLNYEKLKLRCTTYFPQRYKALLVSLLHHFLVHSSVSTITVHYEGYVLRNGSSGKNNEQDILGFIQDFAQHPMNKVYEPREAPGSSLSAIRGARDHSDY